ncbi:hypothetical protein AB6831_04180 [Carnobacterium divergens]|uniref:hypothetical protein n=1 Tax=Carnobacterium divergens TaxID=2748 RepID=UPI0039C91D8D
MSCVNMQDYFNQMKNCQNKLQNSRNVLFKGLGNEESLAESFENLESLLDKLDLELERFESALDKLD